MKNSLLLNLAIPLVILFSSCGDMPTTEESGLKYLTQPAFEMPETVVWEKVGFAKEIINSKEKRVYYGAGSNPIPMKEWDKFEVQFPWVKNLDRNLLFAKTSFLRSPSAPSNCIGLTCLKEKEYQGYSWVELAHPKAIDFIPEVTNTKKPSEGHLVVKVIKKCQIVVWEDEIYELSDGIGNKYIMHATETGHPNLNVTLPAGYTLQKVKIDKPLTIVPFGESEDCFFNIIGDHLGQGYHQYKYANEYYPQ